MPKRGVRECTTAQTTGDPLVSSLRGPAQRWGLGSGPQDQELSTYKRNVIWSNYFTSRGLIFPSASEATISGSTHLAAVTENPTEGSKREETCFPMWQWPGQAGGSPPTCLGFSLVGGRGVSLPPHVLHTRACLSTVVCAFIASPSHPLTHLGKSSASSSVPGCDQDEGMGG